VIVWPVIMGPVAIAALSVPVMLKAPVPRMTTAPMAAPAAFTRRPIVLTRHGRRSCAEVLTIATYAGGLKPGIARRSSWSPLTPMAAELDQAVRLSGRFIRLRERRQDLPGEQPDLLTHLPDGIAHEQQCT
jgi:hypothetical protein